MSTAYGDKKDPAQNEKKENDIHDSDRHDSDENQEDGAEDLDLSGYYWFASTLCPLLAGTFGPMASSFSICALVMNWRVYIPPGDTEQDSINLTDPHWLIAINAASLASALIGNLALLLNMARRLRFSIAQPITISGFFLASILLIVDMAVLCSSKDYRIDYQPAIPSENHALTSAFYYAIFAAALYFVIATLMSLTVHGATMGWYEKNFRLTPSQRTLMLQTMSFFVYLMLGALVWSNVEGWEYLDAVYWADVTLLTIGLGDFSPMTPTGKGLLFPFAIGGIVILGLVVGSIRTLILERGQEKMTARIMEKRRENAINHVDVGHQTIKVGWFAQATFIVRPEILPGQRREEEFNVMRKVQLMAERERRYMSLVFSIIIVCILWFVGAAIFLAAEYQQGLVYLDWLYFSYTSLLTIGYGTPAPESYSGRAFFVFWSLLAIPSLTILISNMGDTVIKGISEATDFVGAITVLPEEHGIRATLKIMLKRIEPFLGKSKVRFTGPGIFGAASSRKGPEMPNMDMSEWQAKILDRLADRIAIHISEAEMKKESEEFAEDLPIADELECDITFYHYVLARECRDIAKHIQDDPPKKYAWPDWEYYIKLMGNETAEEREGDSEFPHQAIPNTLVPTQMLQNRDRPESDPSFEDTKLRKSSKSDLSSLMSTHTWSMPWSWLSNESPLAVAKNESIWIHARLSAALERELNRKRLGFQRKPPISYRQLRKHARKRFCARVGELQKEGNDTSSEEAKAAAESLGKMIIAHGTPDDEDGNGVDDADEDRDDVDDVVENETEQHNLQRAALSTE